VLLPRLDIERDTVLQRLLPDPENVFIACHWSSISALLQAE
jgi:hypothetical protein